MAGSFVVGGREYPFPEDIKLGEARLIKQISGVRTAEIMEAMEAGDPDVLAAMVLIAMRRTGKRVELADLDELNFTAIGFKGDEEEDESLPPTNAADDAADDSSGT